MDTRSQSCKAAPRPCKPRNRLLWAFAGPWRACLEVLAGQASGSRHRGLVPRLPAGREARRNAPHGCGNRGEAYRQSGVTRVKRAVTPIATASPSTDRPIMRFCCGQTGFGRRQAVYRNRTPCYRMVGSADTGPRQPVRIEGDGGRGGRASPPSRGRDDAEKVTPCGRGGNVMSNTREAPRSPPRPPHAGRAIPKPVPRMGEPPARGPRRDVRCGRSQGRAVRAPADGRGSVGRAKCGRGRGGQP
jgi:hypothetical protein